jgi:azurin
MGHRRRGALAGLAMIAALLPACGGGTTTPTPTGPDPDERGLATVDIGARASDAPGTIRVQVGTASGPKEFRYDKATLSEPAGHPIKLKLANHTEAKAEVGHNWVLVKPGQENAVLASGKAAGDNKDWLDVNDPAIVAHTRLIEGGQSNTITFTAPRGTYTYLCTFPGHYAAGEKGTLVIK